ncbi:MAG TPA: hypothetical protein PLK30_20915 [Blastocatellia bacterium]|nr:hypothetical protein [Blastocatellia bacterium]
MKKTKMSLKAIFMATVVLCLSVAALAQQRPQFDPLMRLKQALQSANAPALTTAQEDQLKALIQQAHDAHPGAPDPALEAAHDALGAAIFAGNRAAADAQISIIANLTNTMMTNRMKGHSTFTIQAINVLKSNQAQLDALVQKIGSTGVVQLMGSLVGGPGGPGGPGGGGPGGPGGPGGGRPGGFGGPAGVRPGAPSRP